MAVHDAYKEGAGAPAGMIDSGRRTLVPAAADRIVDAIIQAISQRRLPPGAKLGETQLAHIFDVSRTIVRQALQHLSFIGVVESISNRGAFIAKFTRKQAADLYAARRVIETETILLLARHCTANDIRTLRQHVAWEREMETSGNSLNLVRLRGDFHLVIARLAGNAVLADMLERLLPQTALIRAFYGSVEFSQRPTDDHDRLISLLAKGDEQGCVDLIREHLHLDERRLIIPNNSTDGNFNIASAFDADGASADAPVKAKAETTTTPEERSTGHSQC